MKYQDQRGFVSIFTVLMFAILMSVVTVGFVRLMIDEQQQTLQDDLSKSAYNSAQAGIEDAKRAMLYCQDLIASGDPRSSACKDALYNPVCPGFNAPSGAGPSFFQDALGIPTSVDSKTSVGGSDTSQGYSCVIVNPDTKDLTGSLRVDSENEVEMYELDTTPQALGSVTIQWNRESDGSMDDPYLSSQLTNTDGSPRLADWGERPAVMRITLVEYVPNGATTSTSYFVYPAKDGASAVISSSATRYTTICLSGEYSCSVKMTGVFGAGAKHFLLIRPIYRNTSYRISAKNTVGADAIFKGVSPSIDATGYTSNVYRRVLTRVHAGAGVLPLNGLDAAGICKDFTVNADSVLQNKCDAYFQHSLLMYPN